jgi:hypothetical protein
MRIRNSLPTLHAPKLPKLRAPKLPKLKLPKVSLLKGNSHDIISTNIKSLKEAGYSHKHATHLSLRHSKSSTKGIASKVIKKSNNVTVKGS